MSAVLQTTSTRDALVAELRRAILSGDLKPGAPLVETVVATTYGVARPTVRSALQELLARHLVQSSGGRSLTVPALSGADVRDLFFVRTPLELEAVTRIVEHSLALQDVEQCLQALRSLPQSASWAERVESHTAFHIALIDAAGSTRLSRIYPAMQDEMQLCLAQLHGSYPGSQDLYVEHRQLLDAIKSGSTDRAREEMRQHLHRALRNLGEDPANST